jgi:asparagine synthase (glutamine-hydrolysing)
VLVSVAALGLDKSWLNREITREDVSKLKILNEKYGINVAGEGGEYESVVLDCPLFNKEIIITDYEIVEENENTAHIIVKCAKFGL